MHTAVWDRNSIRIVTRSVTYPMMVLTIGGATQGNTLIRLSIEIKAAAIACSRS